MNSTHNDLIPRHSNRCTNNVSLYPSTRYSYLQKQPIESFYYQLCIVSFFCHTIYGLPAIVLTPSASRGTGRRAALRRREGRCGAAVTVASKAGQTGAR